MQTINFNGNFNSVYSQTKNLKSSLILSFILFCSFATILSLILIFAFIVFNGIKHFSIDMFLPNKSGSILAEMINTIYVEVVALLVAVPVGVGSAIWLTQFCKNKKVLNLINFSTKILASVPSVLFGLFGYGLFCNFLGLKNSILAGSLTMAVCVLPIIIQTSKEAVLAVPSSFQAGALALGSSKIKAIFSLVVPCAMPGILNAIILAAGKIIGESAALVLTIGTGAKLPKNWLTHVCSSGKTLSLQLYFTAGNSTSSNSMGLCFAISTVLLIITLVLNNLAKAVSLKLTKGV